ncbi:hypothetical protein BDZ91DRAFT_699494 [Kalaharituber pfeilii]|nr:hypothetical protein BDZ91DRAFT_699494 [Kalaharituber pfeilii]
MGLAILVVILRIYVRIRIVKTLGADDYVMCLALLFAIGNMICNILQSRHGWGRHVATILPEDFIVYRHISFFRSQLFVLATNSVKVSIALLLMRLATLNKYKKFLWGTIVFMICFNFACLGTLIFNCSPISGAWDPVVRAKGYCYSMKTFRNIGLFNTVVNVTTDIMYATIPIPLIWRLQFNLRTRITLVLILSLGYFACICGIVKGVKQANFLTIKDPTFWDDINTWGFIEMNVGIIAACVPTLKPLFRAVLEFTRGVTSGSGPNSNGFGRTPNGNLTYASNGKKRKDRTNSIQLSSLPYSGRDGQTHTTIDVENKYPHDSSANDSSNFDPTEAHSPKTSQENILPNNINSWPVSATPGSRPSRNVTNEIRMTTEVILQCSENNDHAPIGTAWTGSFEKEMR